MEDCSTVIGKNVRFIDDDNGEYCLGRITQKVTHDDDSLYWVWVTDPRYFNGGWSTIINVLDAEFIDE